MDDFNYKNLTRDKLIEFIRKPDKGWIYRGQFTGYPLATSIERACFNSGINLRSNASKVETETIRQFRRWYEGSEREDARNNTFYCMSRSKFHFTAIVNT